MNGRGYGLAEVGLFLLLAFVLPGFVYLGFFVLYFPNIFSEAVESFGFGNDFALFVFALGVLGGLLLTSICFSIEQLLRKIKCFDKNIFPNMGIWRLGVLESSGKGSLYLRQVTGQAIMHFNIAMGLLVPIVPSYVVYYLLVPHDYGASSAAFYLKLATGIVLIAANFYLAHIFFGWGRSAINKVYGSSLYVFDLHGTLVKGNEEAMSAILEQLAKERSINVTIDKQKLVDLMGAPLEDIIASFISPASAGDINAMTARFRELSDEITPNYLELLEGAKETLVELRSRGNKIAVVTSTNQKMARKMVKWVSLENLVDEVIGMRVKEDAVTFKTQSIERLRQKYDCQKVYMIGDKAEDMMAGYRAGAVTVLLGPTETEQEYANLIIPDLRALLNFCRQIAHDC